MPSDERHLALAEEARLAGELAADLVARDRLQLVRVAVPVDVVAPGLAELVRDDLLPDRERGRRRRGLDLVGRLEHDVVLELGLLVAGEHVLRGQPLAGVEPDEQRQVGPLGHRRLVVEVLRDQLARDAQEQRGVGAGAEDDHLVGLVRRRHVVGADHDDARALQPRIADPVGVGHLRADPVHPDDHEQVGVLGREEVEVDGLAAGHHRVARRQVGVPGVVVERAAADDLLRSGVRANLRVEQRQHVREAVEAEDAPDPEERHAAAHLDRLHAGAVHRLDHARVVALLEQLLGAVLAVVGAGDVLERLRGDRGRVVPGELDPVVRAAKAQVRLRRAVVVTREPGLDPLLEALADHRRFDTAVAVETAAEDETLLADARIPAMRRLVPVEVGRLAVAVGRADPDDDVVLHMGAQQAVVGVVRRTREHEGRVLGELVAVDLLPAAIGHDLERVAGDERARRGAGRRSGARHGEEACRPEQLRERGTRACRECSSEKLSAGERRHLRRRSRRARRVASASFRRPVSSFYEFEWFLRSRRGFFTTAGAAQACVRCDPSNASSNRG